MLKRILHASDFSPASRSAFTMARVLAKRLGARLILFHAYESVVPLAMGMGTPMMPLAGPASGAIVDRLRLTAIRTGERGLERLAARARRDGLRVSKRLAAGAPASAIVWAARKERAAMVVLGDARTNRVAATAPRECRRTGHSHGRVSGRDGTPPSAMMGLATQG